MQNISKVGLIKDSWEIVKPNYKLVAALLGAFIVYQFVQGIVQGLFGDSVLTIFVSLAFTVITFFLQIGLIKIALKLVDKKPAKFEELWAYPQYLLRMIASSILYGLAVVGGLILFVVPGIYLALRLQFYSYVLLDKDTGVIDSLKKSWKLTQGNVINLFLFMLLIIGINILGAIALLVGLLITIPVSFIAVTLLYRKLAA